MGWLDSHVEDNDLQALLARPADENPVKLGAAWLAEKFREVHTQPAPRQSDDHFRERYKKAKRDRKPLLVQRDQETEEHWAVRQGEITDVSVERSCQSSFSLIQL